MKYILAFLLATNVAYADSVAYLQNKLGTRIIITDVKCSNESGHVAYTTATSGKTLGGCWFMDDQNVHIHWEDGDYYAYPITAWILLKQPKEETPL